jgi:hypothetical protein
MYDAFLIGRAFDCRRCWCRESDFPVAASDHLADVTQRSQERAVNRLQLINGAERTSEYVQDVRLLVLTGEHFEVHDGIAHQEAQMISVDFARAGLSIRRVTEKYFKGK